MHFCQVAKIDGNVLLYCFFFTSFFSSLILLTPKKIIIFPSIELAKKRGHFLICFSLKTEGPTTPCRNNPYCLWLFFSAVSFPWQICSVGIFASLNHLLLTVTRREIRSSRVSNEVSYIHQIQVRQKQNRISSYVSSHIFIPICKKSFNFSGQIQMQDLWIFVLT